MEFPKWKKTLKTLLNPVERVIGVSKYVVLSAGVLAIGPGQSVAQPKIPVNEMVIPTTEIKKYSAKYLLKSAARSGFSTQWVQHRSHSSHSSHRSHSSHSSHSSHYSSISPSHYSSSGTPSPPPRPSPSPTPDVYTAPGSRADASDDFDEDARPISKWILGMRSVGSGAVDNEVSVSRRNGRLEISPRSGVSGLRYNGYVSATPYDLTGKQASVEVVQATASTANTAFALVANGDNWFRFAAENGTLYFQSNIAGMKASANTSYNAYQHRFWRFRHDSESKLMFWETSSDGKQWTVRHAATAQIPVTGLYVELNAGTYQSVAAPGTAIFDNFRIVKLD